MTSSASLRPQGYALFLARLARRVRHAAVESLRQFISLLLIYTTTAAIMPVQAIEFDAKPAGTTKILAKHTVLSETPSRPISNYSAILGTAERASRQQGPVDPGRIADPFEIRPTVGSHVQRLQAHTVATRGLGSAALNAAAPGREEFRSSAVQISPVSKASAAQTRSEQNSMAQPQTAPACLYALDPSAQGAFSISGSTSISTSCSAVVESSASQAFQMSGTETLYLQDNALVEVVGGWLLSGQESSGPLSDRGTNLGWAGGPAFEHVDTINAVDAPLFAFFWRRVGAIPHAAPGFDSAENLTIQTATYPPLPKTQGHRAPSALEWVT